MEPCCITDQYLSTPNQVDLDEMISHVGACPSCQLRLKQAGKEWESLVNDHNFRDDLQLIRMIVAENRRWPIEPPSNSSNEPQTALSPPSIPGFQIQQFLGAGGNGAVWKAVQIGLGRQVAIKVIKTKHRLQTRSRLEQECRLLASAHHAHLVAVFANGMVDDSPWLAMEYCPNGNLASRLGHAWNPKEAAAIVMKVAGAVTAIHDKGIIHRDIKPGNILLDGKDQPKLADFDLAGKLNNEEELTRTSSILGTPAYIAPEQVRGGIVDRRADIHGLGAVLYHLLTGRAPFLAESAYGVLLQAVHCDPIPPIKIQPGISSDIDQICRKCLAKDPVERYRSANDLADDLSRFLDNKPVKARPLSRAQTVWRLIGRNRGLAATGLAAILALISVALVSSFAALQAWDFAKKTDILNTGLTKKEKEARKQEELAKAEAARARTNESLALSENYRNRLTLSQVEHAQSDFLLAVERLEQCPFQLRGWEHDFLYSKLMANQFQIDNLPNKIAYLNFNTKTNSIICINYSGTIYEYSLYTGIISRLNSTNFINGQVHTELFLIFNNSNYFAAEVGTGNLHIYCGDNYSTKLFQVNLQSQIRALVDLPAKGILIAGCGDGKIRLIDYHGKKLINVIDSKQRSITSIALSPDASKIAVCCEDKAIFTVDTNTFATIKKIQTQETPFSVDYSPDGKSIIIGNLEMRESLSLRNAETLELKRHGYGHKSEVLKVRYTYDGMYIVSCATDRKIIVWDTNNLRPLREMVGHQTAVGALATHPSKPIFVSGAIEGRIALWNLVPHTNPVFHLRDSKSRARVHSLVEDTANRRLIAGTHLGELWFFRSDNLRLLKKIKILDDNEEIDCLCLLEGQDQLAAGTNKGNVHLFDLKTYTLIKTFYLSSNDNLIKLGFDKKNGSIYAVLIDDTKRKSIMVLNKEINGARFESIYLDDFSFFDTKSVFLDNNTFYYGLPNQHQSRSSIRANNTLKILSSNVGNKAIYGILENGCLFYIDEENGQQFDFNEKYQKSSIHTQRISFDLYKNSLLAYNGKWGFKIWDTLSGKMVLNVEDNTDEIVTILSSRDNRKLFTGSNDITLRLYESHLKCPQALIPIGDPPVGPENQEKLAPGLPARFSLDPNGSLVLFQDSQGLRVFDIQTLRQIPREKQVIPQPPILEDETYRLAWKDNQLFVVKKEFEKENNIYFKKYLKFINSYQMSIDYMLFARNFLNKYHDQFFIDQNLKCFMNQIKMDIKSAIETIGEKVKQILPFGLHKTRD